MKLYYLKREKGRNEILETNISDRLYHSDNFEALLERICQQFPCVSVGYPASGADYDSRKSDSHDDDLYGVPNPQPRENKASAAQESDIH